VGRGAFATTGLYLLSGVLGLAVGSFLNVVVARLPAGHSLSRPPSACPRCSNPIGARDNIPVLSWLLLRGHCRHCAAPISLRYPLLEATTAALFVLSALRFGVSLTTPAVDAFAAGLLALACIDLERYLLPKRIVYVTAALSGVFLLAGAAHAGEWSRLGVAVACAAGAFGLFFALNAWNPRWLGFGDVRLAGVIGLVLGWLGVPFLVVGLLVANLAGVAVAVVLMALGRATRSTPLPYGVFLAGGSLVAALAGSPLAHLVAG
jgi:leader peptidase (prepilin peptidase)/N-methyltransferase